MYLLWFGIDYECSEIVFRICIINGFIIGYIGEKLFRRIMNINSPWTQIRVNRQNPSPPSHPSCRNHKCNEIFLEKGSEIGQKGYVYIVNVIWNEVNRIKMHWNWDLRYNDGLMDMWITRSICSWRKWGEIEVRYKVRQTDLRSPKSPRPGMIYAFSLRPSSIHPVICYRIRY